MNNLLSYFGSIDGKMSASNKESPVKDINFAFLWIVQYITFYGFPFIILDSYELLKLFRHHSAEKNATHCTKCNKLVQKVGDLIDVWNYIATICCEIFNNSKRS